MNISTDLEELRSVFNELHLNNKQRNDISVVVFKNYRLDLILDPTSHQRIDTLRSLQQENRNRHVIWAQKNVKSKLDLSEGSIGTYEESFDETDGVNNYHKDHRTQEVDTPVTLDEARYLLSLYNLYYNPYQNTKGGSNPPVDKPLLDMYVLCDGTDTDNVAIMGCRCEPSLTSEDKGQRSNALWWTTVSCFGPVVSKSGLLRVDQVIQQNGGLSHKENVATSAFAQYEIVGMESHETSVLASTGLTQHTSVTLDCSWQNVKGILERPHSAKCNVHVCAVPGDMRSAAYSVYRELAALVNFAEGLRTEELDWSTTQSSESVEEAVIRLIESEKQRTHTKPAAELQTPLDPDDTDFDALLRDYVIPERQDLYFSEKLWSILWTKATCYDDVVKAFSLVFSELMKREFQPIVHRDNQSTLAKVIRTLYQQETANVNEVDKLTILVEIGLDKLRRDYTNFFIASELTTLKQLQWYIQTSSVCSLKEQISRLQALHNVLEIVVVSLTSLKLPPDDRRVLVRSALNYYQSNPHDESHTFTLPVMATTVQTLYTSLQPSLWRLHAEGKLGSSSYQLSVKQPVSHTVGPDQDGSKDSPASALPVKSTDTLQPVQEPESEDTLEPLQTPKAANVDSDEAKEGAVSLENIEDEVEGSGSALPVEADVVTNKEVLNYKDIPVGDNSDVINENDGAAYENAIYDDYNDYHLTEEDAMELIQELSNPAQVAYSVMQSDDVTGFLRAIGMLLSQGYISEEYAYFLKDAVNQDLEQLLMLQDQEFFGEPVDTDIDRLNNDYVDDILNRPAPYGTNDYFDMNAVPFENPELYPQAVDYDMVQDNYPEETIALAEIARIIADKINNGEISSTRGERVVDILSELLPETLWDEEPIRGEITDSMAPDYPRLIPIEDVYPADQYPSLVDEAVEDLPESIRGDNLRTYETEEDEPIPGGERHVEEEVVVDDDGRPVAKTITTEEETERVFGDEADEGEDDFEEGLEEELQEIRPIEDNLEETEDDVEQALQDVEYLAKAEITDEDRMDDVMDIPGWNELVMLLDQGKISEKLLKQLGITDEDFDSAETPLDQLTV